jgi:hypothetical protein
MEILMLCVINGTDATAAAEEIGQLQQMMSLFHLYRTGLLIQSLQNATIQGGFYAVEIAAHLPLERSQ